MSAPTIRASLATALCGSSKAPTRGLITLCIVLALFFGIGAGILGTVTPYRYATWTSTTGTVTATQWSRETSRSRSHLVLKLSYVFTARSGEHFKSAETIYRADNLAVAPNQSVDVHYDTATPNASTTVYGLRSLTTLCAMFGSMFIVCSPFLTVLIHRKPAVERGAGNLC